MILFSEISKKIDKTKTKIDLKSSDITDDLIKEVIEQLQSCLLLSYLDLTSNQLSKKSAPYLCHLLKTSQTLISLDLSNNKLGDEGSLAITKALEGNKTLRQIRLYGNSLFSESGIYFAKLLEIGCSLTSVDLSWNALEDTAGMALANALKSNHTLKSLNLQCNKLGPETGKAFGEALKKNYTLTSFNLRFNHLGEEGGYAITKALVANRTMIDVNIYDNKLGSNEHWMLLELRKYLAMNDSNYKLLIRHTMILGLHAKRGNQTSLQKFYIHPRFDLNLFKMILEFEGCYRRPNSMASHQNLDSNLGNFEERMMMGRTLNRSIETNNLLLLSYFGKDSAERGPNKKPNQTNNRESFLVIHTQNNKRRKVSVQ